VYYLQVSSSLRSVTIAPLRPTTVVRTLGG